MAGPMQGLDHKFFSGRLCSLAKAGIGRPEFWSPGSTLVPKDVGQEVSSLPGAPSVVRAKSSLIWEGDVSAIAFQGWRGRK